MARQKTIKVSELVAKLNTWLENTDELAIKGSAGVGQMTARDWQMQRMGMCFVVETILHDTNNYNGYTHTKNYEIDETARHYIMPRE